MKKSLLFTVILFVFSFNFVFAQNSAASANRNTAVRCLKLAENCLLAGDWENALRQAELGLAYDENISDLIYTKAAAQTNLGYKKSDVIDVIAQAFEKDTWVGYAKNGARILYADILCDTGAYSQSLEMLDQEPLIFSADAEFIRIKNYYRQGTAEALEKARSKVNTSRRVYPDDSRFPEIFFAFETLFKNTSELKGIEYVIPENVRIIADSYIAKLPDYSNKRKELEIYASFLASDDVRERLVKSVSAKTAELNPLLVIAQKQIGMITDAQAYDNFFKSIDNAVSLNVLDMFISLITDTEVKNQIIEKLTNFDGTIYIDENLDLQNELVVKYSLGRPQYINYDKNNDGNKELYATCDFGSPVSIYFIAESTELFYDSFPNVSKVNFLLDNYTFNFINDDFVYSPFEMSVDTAAQSMSYDFYIPKVSSEISVPTPYDLVVKSNSVELPIEERENAKIVYSTLNGKLVLANFYEAERKYAFCDFSAGVPFVRYVDYDNDDVYETSEFFNEIPVEYVITEQELLVMERIFSKVVKGKSLYLQKIQIDRNSNNFNEFVEEYLSSDGRITSWDNDDNGIIDSQFIRYPVKQNEPVIEEAIFYDNNGLPVVSLYSLDGVPMKMNYGEQEVPIYSASTEHFYWIEEENSIEIEEKIIEQTQEGITQGVIELLEIDGQRYTVIRIGSDYFCKKIYENN